MNIELVERRARPPILSIGSNSAVLQQGKRITLSLRSAIALAGILVVSTFLASRALEDGSTGAMKTEGKGYGMSLPIVEVQGLY